MYNSLILSFKHVESRISDPTTSGEFYQFQKNKIVTEFKKACFNELLYLFLVTFKMHSRLARDVGMMLLYCWPTVYDAGQTLNKHWHKVSYLCGNWCLKNYWNWHPLILDVFFLLLLIFIIINFYYYYFLLLLIFLLLFIFIIKFMKCHLPENQSIWFNRCWLYDCPTCTTLARP